MTEFIERPGRVHAWQWDGSQQLAHVLVSEWGLRTEAHASLRGELHFVCGGDPYPDESEVACVGDWILTPNEGLTFFALPNEDFHQLYSEVE